MSRLLVRILCCAGFALAASHAWAAPAAPKNIELDARQQATLGVRKAAVVAAGRQILLATASVTVPPGREYIVTAPYAGTLTRITAGLGDRVQAGSTLAHYSSPALADLRRQAREAQIEEQNAQAALQRDQAMHEEGLIPAARLQLSLNRQRAAKAAVDSQMAMLRAGGLGPKDSAGDYALGTVRAAATGHIVVAFPSVGQRIDAGTVLFHIADLGEFQLELTLSADKAATVRAGDRVTIASRGATATVLGVGRALDASQQAHARARVITPGRLQLGETLPAQIEPTLRASDAPAWQIPARAIVTLQGQTRVFRATEKGFAVTEVQVLSSNDELAVVTGQLGPQDQIAIAGIAALRAIVEQEE